VKWSQPFRSQTNTIAGPGSFALEMSAKCKAILMVVIAGLVTILAILPLLAARGRIAFGLQSYAQGSAVFMVTNTSRVPVEYTVTVEHKDYRGWPDYLGEVPPHAPPPGFNSPCLIAPGQVSTCTVPVAVHTPARPWRLSVRYWSMSIFDTIRERGSTLLSEYGESGLARQLWPGKYFAIVPGREIEQQ
jgi:hypothetical protein